MGQESWSTTTILAIYGAVLSTIVMIWNIIREITNRGRLRVTVTLAEIFSAGVGRIATDKLWYKVTNVGRQPIWLSQIGGGLSNGKHFLITVQEQFPIKLDPGQDFSDASADASQLGGPEKIVFLGAWDTLGKIHKVPRRRLNALLNELRQKR